MKIIGLLTSAFTRFRRDKAGPLLPWGSLAPSDSIEVRRYGIMHDDVLKLAHKLQAAHPDTALKFCYEAGPRGFALGRCLRSHGLDCILLCPSKIPRKPQTRRTRTRWLKLKFYRD